MTRHRGRTVSRPAPERYRRAPHVRRGPRSSPSVAVDTVAYQQQRTSRPLRLALLVFVQYALIAADIRFVAAANYMGVALVNVGIACNSWYLTRGIIHARTATERWCYVVGGTSGALIAVMVT
jgi:hypothetical protein